MANSTNIRYRNWGLILYPESLPSNWKDIIREQGVPGAYILHDKDTKVIEGGEIVLKKAHYHVILKYTNQKSYQQMLKLSGSLRAPNPMNIESLVAYARDFLHLDQDSPRQHKYNLSEVTRFNGFDFQELIKPNRTEQNEIMIDIRRIVREEGIKEIAELYDHFDKFNPLYSSVINAKTYPISRYIDSYRHKPKKRRDVTNKGISMQLPKALTSFRDPIALEEYYDRLDSEPIY